MKNEKKFKTKPDISKKHFEGSSSVWRKLTFNRQNQSSSAVLKLEYSFDNVYSLEPYINYVKGQFRNVVDTNPKKQRAVFCPLYQQQNSIRFELFCAKDFSEQFLSYLNHNDAILFYGIEGIGCSTILKILCNRILFDQSEILGELREYIPVYIHADRLYYERRRGLSVDKCINNVLNNGSLEAIDFDVNKIFEVTDRLLIILDDLNDEKDEAIFKWLSESLNREKVKLIVTTTNSRVRTKFEKYLPETLGVGFNFATIYLPIMDSNLFFDSQDLAPFDLLKAVPYYRKMIQSCKVKEKEFDETRISSVTSLIGLYVPKDAHAKGAELTERLINFNINSIDDIPERLKDFIVQEGRYFEFENKILNCFFIAYKYYDLLVNNICSIKPNERKAYLDRFIRNFINYTDQIIDKELIHKYAISLIIDPHSLSLTDEDKNYLIQLYSKILPRVLIESLRWNKNGKNYLFTALIGIYDVVKVTTARADIDTIEAELMLYQVGLEKMPFLEKKVKNAQSYILPANNMWITLNISGKEVEVSKFPVTVCEFSCFVNSGYFCEKSQCNPVETFGFSKYEVWDQIWGGYNVDKVKDFMRSKWTLIRSKMDNNAVLTKLCSIFDSEQIKQLYLFKELYEVSDVSATEIKNELEKLYSVDALQYPMKWDDPSYNNPYYPVIGINYYEAMAYCKWLSIIYNSGDHPVNGYVYRLLDKDEWLKMAEIVRDPKETEIICHKANKDDNLRIVFMDAFRDCTIGNDRLEIANNGMPYQVYGNIFELVNSKFSEISYATKDGDKEDYSHYYCFGGSYLQKFQYAYDLTLKKPYKGQSSAFQRNIDIGFRLCRVKK